MYLLSKGQAVNSDTKMKREHRPPGAGGYRDPKFECKFCKLEHLDLSENQISDFTGEKLALVLRKNDTLLHLNLADNLLKDGTGFKMETMLD